jgi:hypothetical protein
MVFGKFRIKRLLALWTDTVGEIGFRVPNEVILNGVPIFLFVPDTLAV